MQDNSQNVGKSKSMADPEKLREFRAATIARIKESKIEAEKKRILEEEEKRKESQAFRIKWREKIKQKRHDEIVEFVNKLTVKDTLPDLQTNLRKAKKQLNFLHEKAVNERNLQSLISDLEGHDARDDLALSRDSGAFKLSISDTKVPSIEFSSGVDRRASIKYLQKVAAFGLLVENRLNGLGDPNIFRDRCIESVPLSSSLEKTQSTASSSSLPQKGFNISNDIQLSKLLQDLVKDEVDAPRHGTTGIMESLFNTTTRKIKTTQEKTLERKNTLTSEMFAQRQVSMFVKMPHTYDADEHKGLVSLCDGYYLVGPGKESLTDGARNAILDKHTKSAPLKPFAVDPQVLSTNFKHELPPEMIELLPAYCFPSGINIKCTEINTQRRNSVASRDEAAPVVPENIPKKPIKKPRVFFPSDYSMKANSTTTANVVNTNVVPPSSPESPSKSMAKSMFVIKLGDHTYQYYSLCILQPVVVQDELLNVEYETSYCICLLMKFPLVSLIANIIECTESIVFHSPVDKNIDGSSSHPAIRGIEELVLKLKRITTQAYPFFLKAETNEKIEQTNLTIDVNKRSNDFLAFIADLNLSDVMTGNTIYRRGYFQRYFSSFPLTYEQLPQNQISTIHQLLGKPKFVPGSTHRAERELEETFHLLLWALPVLVNYLLLDQIVLALGCAMMEMKIIVCHKDPNVVSGIIMALINLLRPLKWCSPLIISLPDSLTDFIDSPVPIIVGLRQLPPNFELQERCVLIDPDVKKIHFHPKDLIENQTIILPNGSRLAHYLRSIANTIKTVTRRKKLEKLKLMKLKKIITKNEASGIPPTSSSAVAATLAVEKSIANPLNFENDASSEDCSLLSGAVNQFSATVSNHILALINTAIQHQAEERRIARDKRRIVKQAALPLSSDSNPERRHSRKIHLVREPSSNDINSDISALDDSVSDITYTDASSAHKKNGSGTEMSSEESINSTTSSLPSIQTGAPILAIKDLRPYEQTFITKLTETQMYSNYCQARKSESPPATVTDINVGNTAITPSISPIAGAPIASNIEATNILGQATTSDTKELARHLTDANPVITNTAPFATHLTESAQPLDSAVELFYIMLNGIATFPEETMHMYQQEYDRIYESNYKTFKASDCEHLLPEGAKNPLRNVGKSRRRLQRLLDKLFDQMAEKELPKVTIQADELRYCSGLLCNGFCNTDVCDCGCIAIWQRKVRLLRKRQAALQIVSQKYENTTKSSVESLPAANGVDAPNNVTTTAPTNGEETKPVDTKLKFISPDGVRLEAVKHGKETSSQYMLRQKVIESQMKKSLQIDTGHESPQGKRSKARGKTRVRAMAKETIDNSMKIKVKTFSDSNNLYVTSLAKYYAAKEEKYLKRLRRKSQACIRRALGKYVQRFRLKKRQRCAILIQSNFRGYKVRKHIPVLVEELYARINQRMIQRCLATIQIRNHIRRNAESILNAFEKKKIARRLAKTSIPVRHSVTMPAKDPHNSVPSTTNGVSATNVSASSATTGPPRITNSSVEVPVKRQLTINERYISDAAPGLMTTATAMLAPTPKGAPTPKSTTSTSSSETFVVKNGKSQPTSSVPNESLESGASPVKAAPFQRPPLLQMSSLSSLPSETNDKGVKSESLPSQPPKRTNSGTGSSLSSAAYDFMVHGIKRRSLQDSLRHPFVNKKYNNANGTNTAVTNSQNNSTPRSATPPPPSTVVPSTNTKSANTNSSQANVAPAAGSSMSAGSDRKLTVRVESGSSIASDEVQTTAMPASSPVTAASSPESQQKLNSVKNNSILQPFQQNSTGTSVASSANTSPSSTLHNEPTNGSSVTVRSPHDFSPEPQINQTPPQHPPAGIAELSTSPIPHSSDGKPRGRLLIGVETMMLSPFSDGSQDPSAKDMAHDIPDPLFSPSTFPVVSSDYDESDDEEKKVNRARTMEKKMKLNMIDNSRSKDFIGSSADLIGLHLGSKSRSNDDVLDRTRSKSGEEIFSAFSDDAPQSLSEAGDSTPGYGSAKGTPSHADGTHKGSNTGKILDPAIRTSLSLGPHKQLSDPSSLPTPRSGSNESHATTHGPLTSSQSFSHRSPAGERKNVTPIGRYTQSQHMIIPITTTVATSSPRVASNSALTEASLQKHLSSLEVTGGGHGVLPPTHPRHPHLSSLPESIANESFSASISTHQFPPMTSGSSHELSQTSASLSHTLSMPVMSKSSHAPPPVHGKLSHTNSADSLYTASSASSLPGPMNADAVQAAASALLSGNPSPATVPPVTSTQPVSGIASGYGAPNVSPMPTIPTSAPVAKSLGLSPISPLPPKSPAMSVPSMDDTDIDEKDLFMLSPSASFRLNVSEYDDHDELEDETLEAERQFPAFKTLGEPVFEVYSRQQRDAIMQLWERLVNGVEVKKHSRNSKPKMKVIFCDAAMTKLSWKTPASKTFFGGASTLMGAGYNRLTGSNNANAAPPGDSDNEDDIQPLHGLRRLSSTSDLNNGRYSISRLDSERVLEFKDILEIRTDASTDVLRRSESKGYLYGGYPTISLVTAKRSLDFEISDERLYNDLLQGFTLVRNYYQMYLREEQGNESTGFALWHHKETSTKVDHL